MADLKAVYAAVDEPAASDALDAFSARWDKKYPRISQSWRENWANLSTYFKSPQKEGLFGIMSDENKVIHGFMLPCNVKCGLILHVRFLRFRGWFP